MRVILNGVDQAEALRAEALRRVAQVFIDAVKEGGARGAPGGILYSAVMGTISLHQFEQIMSALVATRKVRREGDLYFYIADA
jgi:hypothetical protein